MEELFLNIVRFIRKECGETELPVKRETLIEDDLGITGQEAFDLIVKFGKEFKVDIKDFEYSKYFYPEPSLFFDDSCKILPITLGDLEKAVINGKFI